MNIQIPSYGLIVHALNNLNLNLLHSTIQTHSDGTQI